MVEQPAGGPRGAQACQPHGERVQLSYTKGSMVPRAWRRLVREINNFNWRRTLAKFGAKSQIESPSVVWGRSSIEVGSGVHIWHHARIEAHSAGQGVTRIVIGDGSQIQPYSHIAAVDSVYIGKGVLMASYVYITDHDHDFSDPFDPPVSNQRLVSSPTRIEDFVWLGERVMVLKGVTIGERSVIGAGSIVTKDIPAFSVAVGSPARVIQRYDHDLKSWVKA